MKARLVRDTKFGRMVYPKGTELEPLYELEYGEEGGKKKWFVRIWLKGRPFICVTGLLSSDFEFVEGKEVPDEGDNI